MSNVVSDVTQKFKIHSDPLNSEEIHINIPEKGKIKPLKLKNEYSGIQQIQHLQIYTSTNYNPSKIEFNKKD